MSNILASESVSNAQYEAILEQVSDGIIIVDAAGKIKKYNKKCENLFEYNESEVIGLHLNNIFVDMSENFKNIFNLSLKDFSKSGEFKSPYFEARSKSGNSLSLDLSFSEISSCSEENYIVIIKDISKGKNTEKRLASTEAKLLATHASALTACMTFDLETMRMIDVNSEAAVMLNGSIDQIIGLHPAEFSPEFQEDGRPSSESAKEAIEKTVENGRNQFFWTHKRLTGESFPCEINTCVREHDGRMIFVASIRDMTDQKIAEENLRTINEELRVKSIEANSARDEAEKASKEKSNFMANMSHELRTPLNAILGFSETMTLEIFGPMPESYREYAGHVHASASHLTKMIEDLLDLSRIEAGKVELKEEEFSVCETLEEAVQIVSSAQSRPACDFILPKYIVEARIFADQRIFRQVLINLIGNAAKFSDRGQRIAVNCARIDGALHLTIQDRGIGIEPDEIDRLFNPYERSKSMITRKSAGTGLGLPISRSLIQRHDGDLTLTSETGVGTKVTILMPALRVRTYRESAAQTEGRPHQIMTEEDFIERISFVPEKGIVDIDMHDVHFESTREAYLFHDVLDRLVAETGKAWFFLTCFEGCTITDEAARQFSMRRTRTHTGHSRGAVRYGASVELDQAMTSLESNSVALLNSFSSRGEALQKIEEMAAADLR